MKYLVVDDHPKFAKMLRAALLAKSHKVVIANDGLDGLDALDKTRFDVVILDVYMPGHNAVEFLNEIRSYPDTVDLPVYLYSTHAQSVVLTDEQLQQYCVRGIYDKSKTTPRQLIDLIT